MHLQDHFGVSRKKAMADGHKLQQEKVLLDVGKKIFIVWGGPTWGQGPESGGISILGDL